MTKDSKQQLKKRDENNWNKSAKNRELKERADILYQELIKTPDFFDSSEKSKEKFASFIKNEGHHTLAETEEIVSLVDEIRKDNGLQNGYWAAHLDHYQYLNFLTTTRDKLVKEYNCKTPIELMLVDRIVASYWRAMKCDKFFNRYLIQENGDLSYDQMKINFLNGLNRSTELADRQLNANIILLKELKQPKLNVKISTKNAYVANNQQIINKSEENNNPDEITKGK